MMLSSRAQADIRAHAETAYPNEACGLLIGHAREITRAVASANHATDARDHFAIDPALHTRLQRELRGSGESILGIYHSHPDAPAIPSDTDRQHSEGVQMLWMIVAVTSDGVQEMQLYDASWNAI